MLRRAVFAVPVLLVGCSGTTLGARFDGHAQPALVSADQIGEVSVLPAGYDSLGSVRASCTRYDGEMPPDGSSLADVDCSASRLTQAVKERAAEVGGELLVGLDCHSRAGHHTRDSQVLYVSCKARIARPEDETLVARQISTRPAAADGAPKASEAWRISVHYARSVRAGWRPGRSVDHVRQLSVPPVSHQHLGDVVTECERGCSHAATEQAVLVAAGRFGATDVAELSCAKRGEGYVCQGKALAYEVEHPEGR